MVTYMQPNMLTSYKKHVYLTFFLSSNDLFYTKKQYFCTADIRKDARVVEEARLESV